MKKFDLKVITVSILTVLILSGCGAKEASTTVTQEEYTPVEIAAVKTDTIYNSTMITGKIVGKNDVSVIPKIAGRVAEVPVKVGQIVKVGQTIAVIDKSDLQNRVDQAKASMNSAAVGVEQAQVGLKQAENSIKSIQASYNLAKASYDANYEKIQNAKLNLERNKVLYEQGIISKSQLEQAELAASDATIKVLEAQLAQANESLLQSSNGVNQANVGVKQAKAGYEQAKLAYDQAVRALSDVVITSPVDGVVYAVNVEKGEMASGAQPIATIMAVDKVYVKVDVTEKLVTKLQKGIKMNLEVPSVSDKKNTGIITLISPVANLQNNLYTIEVEVDNKDHAIKPGMFAKVEFNTDYKEKVMVVKSEAITVNNKKQIVYVEEKGKAVEKIVVTGLDNGEYVEIKKGVSLNDKVIVKGQELVENGETVKVVGGAK